MQQSKRQTGQCNEKHIRIYVFELKFFYYIFYFEDDAQQDAKEGYGCCGYFLMGLSYFLVFISFPFSLCCCIKVIQWKLTSIFRIHQNFIPKRLLKSTREL